LGFDALEFLSNEPQGFLPAGFSETAILTDQGCFKPIWMVDETMCVPTLDAQASAPYRMIVGRKDPYDLAIDHFQV
jgi:hypothetical protein